MEVDGDEGRNYSKVQLRISYGSTASINLTRFRRMMRVVKSSGFSLNSSDAKLNRSRKAAEYIALDALNPKVLE